MKLKISVFFILIGIMTPVILYSLEEGDEAPKFVNPDMNGKYYLSSKIVGKGWIVLDFFATYCENCKKELPELEEILSEFKTYDFSIYVLALDKEGSSIVKPYFEKHTTALTILIDRFKKTAQAFGIEEIPALFLIDPQGVIVFKRIGYAEENIKDMKVMLTDALLPDENENE
jgi:peroxiredoxin